MYEYHMISIGYSITLQLKKDMSCLLNVCASFEKKSLSPLPHPPTSFYMKPSIMHTFKVGFSWVISVSWEKGTHPSEDFFFAATYLVKFPPNSIKNIYFILSR